MKAARGAFPITPSDSVALPGATTGGIYVGSTGTLMVSTLTGATVQFTAIPAGTTVWVVATQVFATGTSAAGLVGLVE